MIIAISGKSGSGKDTVGKLIEWHTTMDDNKDNFYKNNIRTYIERFKKNGTSYIQSEFQIRKFTTAVEKIAQQLTDIPIQDIEKDRSLLTKLSGFKVRDVLIYIAEPLKKKFGQDLWANMLLKRLTPNSKWIITDLRFKAEVEALKQHAKKKDDTVIFIRVNRKKLKKYILPHYSENELDRHKSLWDYTIDNDGTVEELSEKVKIIIDEITKNNISSDNDFIVSTE